MIIFGRAIFFIFQSRFRRNDREFGLRGLSLAVKCGSLSLLRLFRCIHIYMLNYCGCLLHCCTVSLQRYGVLEGDGVPRVWSRVDDVDGVDPDWRALQEPSDVDLHYAALIRLPMLFYYNIIATCCLSIDCCKRCRSI